MKRFKIFGLYIQISTDDPEPYMYGNKIIFPYGKQIWFRDYLEYLYLHVSRKSKAMLKEANKYMEGYEVLK